MKRFAKTLLVAIVAVATFCSCIFFTGCRDIRKIEITVSVKVEEDGVYSVEEKTLTIDLYRNLADKTVDAIMAYANEGYYNGTFFYQAVNYGNDSTHNSKLMVGDLRYDAENGKIVKNDKKPTIEGQFTHGGTVGSDLVNVEGVVGLWRTWNKNDSYTSYNSTQTGSSTLYFPTSTINAYNDNFCVFGKFDMKNETNDDAWEAIKTACTDANFYTEYVIYYTGEYDETKADNGLEFHCITRVDYDALPEDEKDEIFKPEGAQSVEYESYTIKVPIDRSAPASRIVSIKVK